ncbi:MAG: nucleotidyltransferase family protein [Nitrospirae bacterium]|nr:nucleotidyltransferase family protein [Nitrospirota bacterium]
MFYEELFEKLNKSGIDYVVVGGVALVLHGVVRLTADLDLMVHLEESNLSKFVKIMNELGYRPKVPVKAEEFINTETRATWIREKNMKVFNFFHPESPINLVDVFVEEPLDYNLIKSEAMNIMSGNVSIPVVSVKNLIKLKEISGRPQDIADIAALREIEKSGRR